MKVFTLRMPSNLHDSIRLESFKQNKSMNDILLELIEKEYKEKGEKKAKKK